MSLESQPPASSNSGHPPEPVCPICKGTGFYTLRVPVSHPEFGRAILCKCREPERARQQTSQFLGMSDLRGLERMTFANFIPEGIGLAPADRTNLRNAYQIVHQFAENPQGWLVLSGGFGCGKTHLAAAIANTRLAQGEPAMFVVVPDLLDHLRATFSPQSTVRYDKRFDQVRMASLLILDDYGSQSTTPWAQEKMFQLLNYRYNARLPTVITTNLRLEDIEPRLRSRLSDSELTKNVGIRARDFRQGGSAVEPGALNTLGLLDSLTFTNWDRRPDLPPAFRENLELVYVAARSFAQDPRGWLFLCGVSGCGKTHLAAAIANAIQDRGQQATFVVVPDLLDHLRAAFNPQSNTPMDKRFEEVRRAPLLVLDDLGTESATPWAREKLFQLLNFRYNARLATVITTVTEIERLDDRLATRILDANWCRALVIEAPAYRGRGSRRAPRPAMPGKR